MGLLKSVDNASGIDFYDYRADAYYNKYVYRVRFTLPGIRYAIYEKNVKDFLARVNLTTGWRKIRDEDIPTINENLESLKNFIELRNNFRKTKEGIIRVEHNTVAVFSNDLSMLKSIESIDPTLEYDYTEIQKSDLVGVKYFVNDPKHKFRVYLKAKRVDISFSKELHLVFGRTEGLHPSPALKYWAMGTQTSRYSSGLSWRLRWTSASHFIDYDDESTLSYLALMYGDMLGKRYKLEKRPEAV
jgi:hypothetical protein